MHGIRNLTSTVAGTEEEEEKTQLEWHFRKREVTLNCMSLGTILTFDRMWITDHILIVTVIASSTFCWRDIAHFERGKNAACSHFQRKFMIKNVLHPKWKIPRASSCIQLLIHRHFISFIGKLCIFNWLLGWDYSRSLSVVSSWNVKLNSTSIDTESFSRFCFSIIFIRSAAHSICTRSMAKELI